MNKWKYSLLDGQETQILDGDRGKNYPSKQEMLPHGDCLFLSATNVTNVGFNFGSCEFVSFERDALLGKGKLQRQDSILTTRGTVGNVAFYSDSVEYENVRINSGMVIIRPSQDYIDPYFLAFFLRSKIFTDQVKSLTSGSAQPQLPIRDLRQVKMPVPPMSEQRTITAMLRALDDKIELNRKTAATLEEMARALYRSWFVDFDPVYAKAEGLAPVHMDAPTAALFPDGFGDDGLPEGWERRKVGDICRIKGGKQLTKDRFSESGQFPVFGGAGHMGQSDEFNTDGYVITVGRVGAYCGNFVANRGKSWVNNNASHVVPESNIPAEFLFLSLRCLDLSTIKKGAAQPFISNGDLAGLELVISPEMNLRAFNDRASAILLRMEALHSEARTLAALRDMLLQRLMSGELRVGKARERLEEVV